MTAAQREFHERLRMKHLEIQKSILAQQEELRRVETELLLAQYGAWGPTVLKVRNVPCNLHIWFLMDFSR